MKMRKRLHDFFFPTANDDLDFGLVHHEDGGGMYNEIFGVMTNAFGRRW